MDTRTATFRLGWQGHSLEGTVEVPAGPTRPRVILPVIQKLTNALVSLGEEEVAARGETISCRAGCGACCRQLVPITETEAHHLRDLIESLPESRREVVKKRFVEAVARLEAVGIIEWLRNRYRDLNMPLVGMEYFRQGIPCPFLEEESCSIHPDRPLSCREYLVVSPRENCTAPSRSTIQRVPTPGFAMTSFATLDGPPDEKSFTVKWLPLILTLEWTEDHSESTDLKTGPELMGQFMTAYTKTKIPMPVDLPTEQLEKQN